MIYYVLSFIIFSSYMQNINSNSLLSALNCTNYSCESFTNTTTCATISPIYSSLTNSISLDYYKLAVNQCGGTQYCNMPSSYQNITSNSTYYCQEKSYLPLVHGESCTLNTDCASGLCESSCIGLHLYSPCNKTNQCWAGKYCDSQSLTCAMQKNLASSCVNDDECVNKAGCLNGSCVEYWSLPAYSNVTSNDLAELYCQSGFSFQGQCVSITNIDPMPLLCQSTCNYTIKENNLNVSLSELCTCGFNQYGNKYCQHGHDSIAFGKYVDLSKFMLEQGCQVSKKFTCSDHVSYMDVINRQNYYYSWKGKYQLADSCIVDFFSEGERLEISLVYLKIFFILFFNLF